MAQRTPIQAHIPLQVFVRQLRQGFPQGRQGFGAMAGFRQLDRVLCNGERSAGRLLSGLRSANQKPSNQKTETRKLSDQAGACMV